MGSVIYDYLNDSIFFKDQLLEHQYSSISDLELKNELKKYKKFALSNIKTIHNEINSNGHKLRIFGARDYFTIEHLMQTAFYLDMVILPDLILPFSRTESSMTKSMNQYLGMNGKDGINRKSLADAVKKMKTLAPMVAGDYLKFFPVSYYLEPDDEVPITYSETGYSDILPADILSAYRDKAEVRSLIKSEDGWIIENGLEIGRGIAVQFGKHNTDEDNIRIYNLFQQEVVSVNEDTRIVHFMMTLPENPPPIEEFKAWVNQSINQAAISHYQELIKGFFLSSNFGASFLTCSNFTNSLLGTNVSKKSISNHTAECVMNLDLPYLSNISMQALMNIRQNDGEAFALFRRELESRFNELRTETDAQRIKIKVENAIYELSEVQVAKIDQKVKGLKKGALAQVAVAAGGLAGSVATSGISIAATLVALANGFHSYSEYREKIRENPAYFLWKVKNT